MAPTPLHQDMMTKNVLRFRLLAGPEMQVMRICLSRAYLDHTELQLYLSSIEQMQAKLTPCVTVQDMYKVPIMVTLGNIADSLGEVLSLAVEDCVYNHFRTRGSLQEGDTS